jgi:Flp pilus assembly protein TadB
MNAVRRRLRRLRPPERRAQHRPVRLGPVLVAVLCGLVLTAGLVSGAVAALICLAYGVLAIAVVRRTRRARQEKATRTAALDALADMAAALRAGARITDLPPISVKAVADEVDIALAVAGRTGAPLADLLDRVEERHRYAARQALRAEAESAGARVTAVLLLVLPLGGIGLGRLIGVPVGRILLHTPIGAGCVATALVLQLCGLLWVARITAPRTERGTATQLPFAAEMLAAVLRAGVPVDHGVLAVAEALPLGDRLTRVGRALRLGAPADAAWRHLADLAGAHRLIAAAARSSGSGAALASGLRRVAGDLRADEADRAEARARRAGVLLVLPLGLCFLPAFVLAGLTPVVVAVVSQLHP